MRTFLSKAAFGLLQSPGSRTQLAGWTIAVTFVCGVANTLIASPTMAWSGLGYWVAALLIASSCPLRRRTLSIFLLAAGIVGLCLALYRGAILTTPLPMAANSRLISMLVAATLLASFGKQTTQHEGELPTGRNAIIKTILASHLLGAVLNFSAVYLLGDKMTERRSMDERQALILTRGFASAGFWSPFFITMAVALHYAPGSDMTVLLGAGAIMSVFALFFTYREAVRMQPPDSFIGYPIDLKTLRLPVLLIGGVIGMHIVHPDYHALDAIALLAMIIGLAFLILRPEDGYAKLKHTIGHRLPELGSEIALFIAAGIFSSGCSLLFSTLPGWKPFVEFGFAEATSCFLLIVLLAQFGVHPVASISFIGPMVAGLSRHPTLVASVFLYAWALSSAVSPLSSQNLGTFTRYSVDGRKIHLRNLRYAGVMSLLMITSFFLFSRITA